MKHHICPRLPSNQRRDPRQLLQVVYHAAVQSLGAGDGLHGRHPEHDPTTQLRAEVVQELGVVVVHVRHLHLNELKLLDNCLTSDIHTVRTETPEYAEFK